MEISFIKREISRQFIRFCFVGAESLILVYLVFIVLSYFINLSYIFSYILSFVSGTLFSFFFNKLFSFKSKRAFLCEIWTYFLVYLISLILGGLLLKYLVNQLYFEPLFATIPVFILTISINFLGSKFLVFNNKEK